MRLLSFCHSESMAGHRTQYRCPHQGDLVKRCLAKNLTHAALTGRGLQQLLARLRVTDGGTAPRGLLPLATAPSMDLGVRGSLPLINGVTGAGTRQMEVRHDLSTAAVTPGPADGSAHAQVAAASASANASVLVSAKASAPAPQMASTKVRSAAYLQKQANTARTQYAAMRDAAYKPWANTLVKDFKRTRAKGSEHSPTGRSRRLRFAAFL